MRNYIILNGKNSNEINGLLIQELPPISKPQIRTEIEEIDGRDGDIVTKLGFAAYDKEISVGLYKDFDINEIIAYFNSEGTIVFSNEPDKYYNYQIIDQIDFERLVRYRTATIRMHCQPFKYSTTQGTITKDASATVSDEGSNLVLENTAEAPFNKLEPKGNATQKTVAGKNLLYLAPETHTSGGITWTVTEDTITLSGTATGTSSNGSFSTPPTPLEAGIYRLTIPETLPYRASIQAQEADATNHGFVPVQAGQTTTVGTSTWTTAKFRLSFAGWQVGDTINFSFPNRVMFSAGEDNIPYEPYVGGVPSPNPSYPQTVNVVTGLQTVKITGKNLFNADQPTGVNHSLTYTNNGDGSFSITGTADAVSSRQLGASFGIHLQAGETYSISANNPTASGDVIIRLVRNGGGVFASRALSNTNTTYTYLATQDDYCTVQIRVASEVTLDNFIVKPQVELGSTATEYEQYQSQNYPLSLGTIELAKISNSNYEDIPVKINNTWYIRRLVGKLVLDGTEAWSAYSHGNACYINVTGALMPVSSTSANTTLVRSDYYSPATYSALANATVDYGISLYGSGYTPRSRISIRNKDYSTAADLKTWLATHNTTVYYALAEPVDEEITDATLIEQLEALAEAHSYKGRTHINATATGNNAPHIIAAEVGVDNESTVTNSGNINSKPVIKIYGSGNIGAYLNDIQILQIALGDEGYITIDTNLMEAYKDTLDNLKNRLVTGDYSKFSLKPGANKIHFSGTVTKYEISKYSRWL